MYVPVALGEVPGTVLTYLGRCNESESFVTWWQKNDPKAPHDALWVITFDTSTRIFTALSFPLKVSHWGHQIMGGDTCNRAGLEGHIGRGLWGAPESAKAAVSAFLTTLET